MASLADVLWQEFAVETEEHLQIVEPLLARGDPQHTDASDIAQLFRSFHSVKGIARALDVLGMESVSHHGENLLGLVRDGRAVMSAEFAELLLEAVDALKQMRGQVVAEHRDVPPDPALLSRLEAACARVENADAEIMQAPELEPPQAAGDGALHEDPEMLGIFVEMLKQRGVELCGALSPADEERAAAADAAEGLAHAAEVMAFDALSASFLGLLGHLRDAAPGELDPAVRAAILPLLSEISLQISLVGEITDLDAGAAEFSAALAARSGADHARLVGDLDGALDQLRCSLDAEDWAAVEADAAPVARLARQLHADLAARSLTHLPRLALLVDDLFNRAAIGEFVPSDALLDATQQLAALIGDAADVADCSDETAAALGAQLRGAIEAQRRGEDETGRIVGGVYLPAELLAVLSAENLARFEQGLDAGLAAYAVLLFLEHEPATAERLVRWLSGETRVIANRTVLTGAESWFEFLVLSSLAPAQFNAALLAHDPQKLCVKRLRRLTEQPAGEPVLDGASEAPPEPQAAGRRSTAATNVIRVRSEAIDAFLDQVGEMRVAAGALSHVARASSGLGALSRIRQLAQRLPVATRDELFGLLQILTERERLVREAEERVSGILGRLHQSALEFRVVPVEVIFNRFPRVVRDLAARQGKSVELTLEGRNVRIDKSMVEALADPLLHMVRNAVDHGIEPPEERRAAGKPERARLMLRASQRGSEIEIEIADDGRGLDAAAIRARAVERGLVTAARAATLGDADTFPFIFSAGLSTAAAITETSGRGVGMDVVLNTVRRLNGDISIRSERAAGTTFTLTLPVSAALQNVLIVRVGDQSLAIPERHVAAVIEVGRDAVTRVGQARSIVYRQAPLPLYDLGALLGMAQEPDGRETQPTIVASNGRNLIGLSVGAIEHRQELFLKDLHPLLARFPGIGGASVLGDGRVVLVLDGDELIQLAAHGIEATDEQRAAT